MIDPLELNIEHRRRGVRRMEVVVRPYRPVRRADDHVECAQRRHRKIQPGIAQQDVVAGASGKLVLSRAAQQGVVGLAADDEVVAAPTCQQFALPGYAAVVFCHGFLPRHRVAPVYLVVSVAAVERVGAAAAHQVVVARPAFGHVAAVGAVDDVVAARDVDGIAHAARVNHVASATADDVVVVGAAFDVVVAAFHGVDDVEAVSGVDVVVSRAVEYLVGEIRHGDGGVDQIAVDVEQVGPGGIGEP